MALKANELAAESDLIIFSDGPKSKAEETSIAELRLFLKDVDGFKRIDLIERESNLGLAQSIISGVTDTVEKYGKVIVLEDDMLTSPYFLRYMNDALDLYRDEEEVISIAAYLYPVASVLPRTFFLRGTECWGWATWKRGWQIFEPDGQKLLNELEERGLNRRFDVNGTFTYTRMLRNQIAGRNDSWAVRWHASAFLRGKLTLFPGKSLVQNIGNDGSGTHTPDTAWFDVKVDTSPVLLRKLVPEENFIAAEAVEEYFRKSRMSLWGLWQRMIWKIFS